jgi:hypothetical protein
MEQESVAHLKIRQCPHLNLRGSRGYGSIRNVKQNPDALLSKLVCTSPKMCTIITDIG